MIRFDKAQHRVWIGRRRIHGFAVGTFAVGFGLALMLHDWPDRKVAFRG